MKEDYCSFDKNTKARNLMWCNFAKERNKVIATDELYKIVLHDKNDLFFYLERTEELYIASYGEICSYISSLEPWEVIDAVIFDQTMDWTIAVTHEDFSILIGLPDSPQTGNSQKNLCGKLFEAEQNGIGEFQYEFLYWKFNKKDQ